MKALYGEIAAKLIDEEIAKLEEIKARNDLTEYGHAQLTLITRLKREINEAVQRVPRHECDDRCVNEFGYQTRACPAS